MRKIDTDSSEIMVSLKNKFNYRKYNKYPVKNVILTFSCRFDGRLVENETKSAREIPSFSEQMPWKFHDLNLSKIHVMFQRGKQIKPDKWHGMVMEFGVDLDQTYSVELWRCEMTRNFHESPYHIFYRDYKQSKRKLKTLPYLEWHWEQVEILKSVFVGKL